VYPFGTHALLRPPAGGSLREEKARLRVETKGSVTVATTIAGQMSSGHPAEWTAEERAREERARAIRARHDREKTPEERLEDTLRLSRLMSELRQGVAGDVPSR